MIMEMAIDLLFDEVSREKFAKVKHPRKKPQIEDQAARSNDGSSDQAPSRHIPSEVKRAVWQRDQGRCAFVSKSGKRCSERGRIEYHHVVPFAWGGESSVQNIQLRCRTHNAYEGEIIFGKVVKNGKSRSPAGEPTGSGTSSVRPSGSGTSSGTAEFG